MNWYRALGQPSWLGLAQAAGVLVALAVAFAMGLMPKRDYPYPLHVDEWIQLDLAQGLLRPGAEGPLAVEGGFHLLLAQLYVLTGLDWFSLFRWLPPLFFATTVLLTYLVGRRFGCGLESAFLATLVPTSIRFLGPAFLVPVALGIMALPLLLFMLSSSSFGVRHAALCTLVLLFVGVTSPTSALILALVILIHAVFLVAFNSELTFRVRVVKGLLVLLTAAAPAIVIAALRSEEALHVLQSLAETGGRTALPPVRDAVAKFGAIPAGMAIFGILILGAKGGWQSYAWVATALALLVVISLYKSLYLGYQSLADRAWLHLLLLMALLGGYGLGWLRLQLHNALGRLHPKLGTLAAVGLIAWMLTAGTISRLQEPYYHLVDEETMSDFLWIKENLRPTRRVAVLRTDVARAYGPLTGGGFVYAVESWPFLEPRGREAMAFLYGPPEFRWWRDRGISIVYAPHWGDSPAYLDQVRTGIFVPSPFAPP